MNDGSRDVRLLEAASMTRELAAQTSCSSLLQQSLDAMNGQTIRRTIVITDPLGLHMRPLTVFVQRALQFQSSVTVSKADQQVNGKSPLELMLLAAEQGTELILEVSGSDAQAAADVLAQILAAPGVVSGEE